MELKTYFAQDAAGNIISSAIVNVFLQGTTTPATGLTRADGTPLENPFAADGAGRIQFRAPDGYYDIQVSAGSGIIQTLTIQCVDYSGAKADADRAEAAADRADVSAEQVADAIALRGDLEANNGELNIGICPTISALRSVEPKTNGQRITLREHTSGTGKGGGQFRSVVPGTGYTDNNGTIIRTTGGAAWLRINADILNPLMFGAVGNGRDDDSPPFSATIDAAIRQDVGGLDYPNRIFGRKIRVTGGTYEMKSKIVKTLNYNQNFSIEGDHELLTMISVNNPDGFLDITCNGRASAIELQRLSILAKWGTASSQPGVGRDDLPATIADVHDIPSGDAIKVTWPEGISTVKAKTFKLRDVIMTGWNRTRGDFFSNGVYLIGGRAPRMESVVVEGKYGMFITGKPDSLYSSGTAYHFVDTYSPYMDDCYCNHIVRGFDLTSRSTDPGYSTSEGGIIQNGAFDAMYGLRISLPSTSGEPGFIINNQHFNYSKIGIDMQGKNQVQVTNCLFYCEASTEGVTCRDIYLRGAQKSSITNNIFGKTNTGNRFTITLAANGSGPSQSCVINNNMHWAGATGTYRTYNIGATGVSNITIGDGECYEGSVANLFTLNGTGHSAVNPMRFSGDVAPEGAVWAPLGSLYVMRTTGVLYKKGGTLTSLNGWTAVA